MTDLRTIEKIEYGSSTAIRITVNPEMSRELSECYIAFDTETTGLDPEKDRIVEPGDVAFENGKPAASFHNYVNPKSSISPEVSALNHITNKMREAAPAEAEIYPEFLEFFGNAGTRETVICGHVAAFARKTFGMYGGKDRKLTLEGENYLAGVVIDRFGTDVMMHPYEKDKFRASVEVTISPQFFGRLAGLGKGIRISWPENVREEYKAYLKEIADSN